MDDLELYIYIALGAIYFLSRASRKKKPVTPPKNRQNTDTGGGYDQTTRKEKPVTFEDLLREFTGQKEETVYDYEEENREPDRSYDEDDYYQEEDQGRGKYETEEPAEYKSFEEVYNVSNDLKTLDEQVDLEQAKKKRFEEYKIEEGVNIHTAKRFRELLQNKDSIKDAIILKEILDRRYF